VHQVQEFYIFSCILRHKIFVLTPSWSLSFGIVFTTLSLGCVNNATIVRKESAVMSQSVMNYWSN